MYGFVRCAGCGVHGDILGRLGIWVFQVTSVRGVVPLW